MIRSPHEIRGSIVPMVTPFDGDGSVDLDTLKELIEWQIESGSHGISVTGTTGEPSSLTLDEREEVMAAAAEAVQGRVPYVPGTGTNNLDQTIRLTVSATRLAADAALVIVPYYNKPSQEGLYRYFAALCDATEIPIVIYNIPGRTATNMAPATMARLRKEYPQIIGVKESNKDFEHVSRVLHEVGRDFNVYSGIELLCFPMLAIGGAGHVSATGNVLPKEVALLYDHVMEGKWEDAIDLHYHLLPINDAIFFETNPGPLKYMLARMGKVQLHYRLPLCEPAEPVRRRIDGLLEGYGLI